MRLPLLIVAMASLVIGCGWQLRGTQMQQGPLPSIAVVGDDSFSPMALTIQEAWQRQSDTQGQDPLYTVQILRESVDRRPVTYTASGTPAQYEMTLELTYAVQTTSAAEPTLPRSVATHRLFDFDPRNVVAKAEEERVLLQHMRQELARRVLSEISREHQGQNHDTP